MQTSVSRAFSCYTGPESVPSTHSIPTVPHLPSPSPNGSWLHRQGPVYTQWGVICTDTNTPETVSPPPSHVPAATTTHPYTPALHATPDDVFFHQYISALQQELVSSQRDLSLARAAAAEAESLRAELGERTRENQALVDTHASLRGTYETHMAQEIARCKAHYT
ncbi:hypothetical protein KIPB_011055, partial [Kipferlia bialata]|eukprot:g11055.t1